VGPAGLGGWRAERGEQGWAFVAKMAPVPLHVLGHRPAGCSHTLPPPPFHACRGTSSSPWASSR